MTSQHDHSDGAGDCRACLASDEALDFGGRPPSGTRVHAGNDPENQLQAMRLARTQRRVIAEVAPIVDRTVEQARGHWPDPVARETAGFGALMAAACFAEVAQDGPQSMMLNFVALFGQSLVDDARRAPTAGGDGSSVGG